jgi:hypothetical protein
MKILIAEDEVMMLKTMQLIRQGFEVVACSNEKKPLKKLFQRNQIS